MDMESKKQFFMVPEDGHLSDEASALMVEMLLHGDLTGAPQNVLTHVEACRECKNKIMEVVTFRQNPETAGDLRRNFVKKTKAKQEWHFYRGKIAAVFVVFALLASAYFFIFKDPSFIRDLLSDSSTVKQEQKVQDHTTPITPEKASEKKAQVLPEKNTTNGAKTNENKYPSHSRYRVNPNLENMIGSRLRSGVFEITAPGNNSTLEVPIHFAWKTALNKSHTLKIVNNKNHELFIYAVQGNTFDFSESLVPGLYYWKLESPNELLYVGKFFIGTPPPALYPK